MPRPVTLDEIYDVAEQAVDIFRSHDLHTCLFGSAACSLYGVNRTPNVSSGFPHGVRDLLAELLGVLMRLMQDVDLVVLTKNYDQEELKQPSCRQLRRLLSCSLSEPIRNLQRPLVSSLGALQPA